MTDLGSPSNQARKRLRVDQNYNSVTMSNQNGVNSAKSSINGSDSSSAAGSENDEFTDGDFDDSDGEVTICAKADDSKGIPCNEAVNPHMFPGLTNGGVQLRDKSKMNSLAPKLPPENNNIFNENNALISNEDLSIIGILGKDHDRAEARLAARRAARAEAREIRMRELERQQKEQEENADRVYDMYSDGKIPDTTTRVARVASRVVSSAPSSGNYHSSRRSSEDSVEEMGSIRDIRHELKEVEEKFRKAMILNAQLDNDKASFSYQLELLKDKLEDLQEQYTQLQREHKDKCRAFDSLTRECRATREELERCTAAVLLRDRCIREAGLELVAVEGEGGDGAGAALVSSAGREALEQAGQGTLDVRLQTLCSERQTLENEVKQLKTQLEEERSRKKSTLHNSSNGPVNGSDSDSDSFDHQRENSKLVADYKFRACKAEQDVLTLQATVARLDSQVLRYRSAAEQAERMEDELKSDRRKLQREAREALSRVEELETENSHLNKRLDKLKTAKSALLKEL